MTLHWTINLKHPDQLFARVEIAPHFKLRYTIWADEDGVWFGQVEFWYLESHREDTQYATQGLEDYFDTRHCKGLDAMEAEVERVHTDHVLPGFQAQYAEYAAPVGGDE